MRLPAAIISAFLLLSTNCWSQGSNVHSGWPSVSPNGAQIAFFSNRDGKEALYATTNGRERKLAEGNQQLITRAQWIDDKHLAYAVIDGDKSRIYALSLGNGIPMQIGEVPGRAPLLSPDGKTVLYTAGPWRSPKIFTSKLDG